MCRHQCQGCARHQHSSHQVLALQHSIRPFLWAHDRFVLQRAIGADLPSFTIERATEAFHLMPGPLLSADGRLNGHGGFDAFWSATKETF